MKSTRILWILWSSVWVHAARAQVTHFRRQIDPYRTWIDEVLCDNETMIEERNRLIDNSMCAVREVFLSVTAGVTYESVDPPAFWAKRCVGSCPFAGPDRQCQARKVKPRKLAVRIYNAITNKERCSTFVIEDHVSCQCYGPESTCSPQNIPYELTEVTKGRLPRGISTGKMFMRQCKGTCSENHIGTLGCMPQTVATKTVRISEGDFVTEQHTSCNCNPVLEPCELREAFVELPSFINSTIPNEWATFKTNKCSGNCLSRGYKCMPLKTLKTVVPGTMVLVEEHVYCICAKKA